MQVSTTTTTKEVVTTVEETTIVLTLSLQEASDLMTLCGNLGGKHPDDKSFKYEGHIRRTTDKLYEKLNDLEMLNYDPETLRGAILVGP